MSGNDSMKQFLEGVGQLCIALIAGLLLLGIPGAMIRVSGGYVPPILEPMGGILVNIVTALANILLVIGTIVLLYLTFTGKIDEEMDDLIQNNNFPQRNVGSNDDKTTGTQNADLNTSSNNSSTQDDQEIPTLDEGESPDDAGRI